MRNVTAMAALVLTMCPQQALHAETLLIGQSGQMFSQDQVSIKAGDRLKFLNQDDVNHNILVQTTDEDDDGNDLGVQAPGGSVEALFDKAGKFKVRCHIHPGMRLQVRVQ